MLDGVDAPGHGLAHLQKAVDGPGGAPHEVGPGLVVVGGGQGLGAVVDTGLQNGLGHAVGQVGGLHGAEIVFKGMGHDVRRAGRRLGGGQGAGIGGVQNGHGGQAGGGAEGQLFIGVHVGDDCDIVHLGAGGGHGQHREDGQGLLRHGLAGGEVPGVAIIAGAGGDGLGAVDDAAAAQSQHAVQTVLTAQLHALADGGDAGIGLHAAQLDPFDVVLLQLGHGAVIHAVALDAASAVDHQHPAGPAGDLPAQLADLSLAEVDHRGNGIGEIFHRCEPTLPAAQQRLFCVRAPADAVFCFIYYHRKQQQSTITGTYQKRGRWKQEEIFVDEKSAMWHNKAEKLKNLGKM